MNILITGGAGFIGSHLSERFLRDGYSVCVLDNFDDLYDTRLKEKNVELCRARAAESGEPYELVEGDVRDEELVRELVDDADMVYHQGGVAGVRRSAERPREYNQVNVDGTLNILEAARDADVDRIVYASSSSVYGKPIDLPYDEHHPTTPVSPYGVSKLAGERYCCCYNEVYGLPTVALRYFTVYGPRMRPDMAISNFVSRCSNGKPPVVYGDGSQTRDFTYITDVVEANMCLTGTSTANGEAINIGSSVTIDIRTLAEEVRDQLAPELELVHEERHDADAEHTHAEVSKAEDLLGYEPSHTIREGVGKYIEWYRNNREWYEPLVAGSGS
jgi:UDP-glucose 4-epimerase